MRRQLTQADMERMRIPLRFWESSASKIPESSIREPVLKYLREIEDMAAKGYGMILMGDNGRGKTACGCLMLMEARRRAFSALFVEASAIRSMVFEKEMFDSTQTMWERIVGVDFLLIDDFGKGTEDARGYAAQIVDDIVRLRSANLRPTIITTNMDVKKLAESGAMKKSTVQALLECAAFMEADGHNLRAERVKQIAEAFR